MSESNWCCSPDDMISVLKSIAESDAAMVRARHQRDDDVDHDFSEAKQIVICEIVNKLKDPNKSQAEFERLSTTFKSELHMRNAIRNTAALRKRSIKARKPDSNWTKTFNQKAIRERDLTTDDSLEERQPDLCVTDRELNDRRRYLIQHFGLIREYHQEITTCYDKLNGDQKAIFDADLSGRDKKEVLPELRPSCLGDPEELKKADAWYRANLRRAKKKMLKCLGSKNMPTECLSDVVNAIRWAIQTEQYAPPVDRQEYE